MVVARSILSGWSGGYIPSIREASFNSENACEFAEELHVKNLLLYHTEDRNLSHRKELYYEEGRKYFSGNLLIPDDLETFII